MTLGLVVIALIVGMPLGVAKWRRWEGRKALGKILAQTGGELISHHQIRCRRRGHELWLFRDRNRGTTILTSPLPAGYPLTIDVRRRGIRILGNGVPSLDLGDVQFDKAFRVEAAPAAVVELLLGVGARSFLLDRREPVLIAKDGRFQLNFDIVPAPAAIEAVEVAASIVAGIRDAFAKLAEQAEAIGLTDGDSPYRPIAVDNGPDLERAHAAEVEKLGALQRRGAWIETAKWLALVAVAAGAIKLMTL